MVAEYFPRRFRLSLEEVVADGCEEVGGVVVVVVGGGGLSSSSSLPSSFPTFLPPPSPSNTPSSLSYPSASTATPHIRLVECSFITEETR